MSVSLSVFTQDLHNAFPGAVSGGPLEFQVNGGVTTMNIHLTQCPDRVIALVRLPILKVCIHFIAGNITERNAMLQRMDLYMQRGGG